MPHRPPQPTQLKTTSHVQDILEPHNEPWQVELKDPATTVMTDFHVRGMFKITPDETIDQALHEMKVAGLRIAFVKEKGSDKLLGSITAYDIMGSKPMQYLQSVGFADRAVTHKDIRVSDIMEHTKDWVVAEMHDVEKATVKDVLAAMQKAGRTHMPVLEVGEGKQPQLRGLFSSAKILRLTELSRQKSAK
jgi:CBS domain-containing protein